ncbi:MAG: GAF domain-containing protein [Acidimicrobiales bacterium]
MVELGSRLAAATGLEEVVDATLLGLEEVLGHRHSILLLHQEEAGRLVALASRGYDEGGVGSEVGLGDGVIGMAAARRSALRIGNLQRMLLYAKSARRVVLAEGGNPGTSIELPGLDDARSQLAVPLLARDQLVGVLAVESVAAMAYDEVDELALRAVGHLVAAALEREHAATAEPEEIPEAEPPELPVSTPLAAPVLRLRHYEVDGSTFLDDDYLIKGVAGRLLWKVVTEHVATGRTEFTNREARLDPALELPSLRDNFESRLILLKRRLEERDVPLRITSLGRGRFGLEVRVRVVPERVPAP